MYFRKSLILQRIFSTILGWFLNQNISRSSVKSGESIAHKISLKFLAEVD